MSTLYLRDLLLVCEATEHDFIRNAGGLRRKVSLEQRRSLCIGKCNPHVSVTSENNILKNTRKSRTDATHITALEKNEYITLLFHL